MKKTGVLILIIVLLMLQGAGFRPKDDSSASKGTVNVPVIHPRTRVWASPSGGLEAQFNPPVLLWPSKKNTTYSVRLSTDSGFKSDQTIQVENLKRALFNPHRKLASGKWFWQYKMGNGEWSKMASFQITDQTPEMVSPDAQTLLRQIPADHPRILAWKHDPNKLKTLQENPDAKAIIDRAKELMAIDLPKEADGYSKRQVADPNQQKKLDQDASQNLSTSVYERITALSQAFLLTGNEAFRAQAVAIAMEVSSWNPDGVTKRSDFGDARCMVAMAIAFDTFYEQLSPAQKSKLVEAITLRARGFYNEWVNSIESKVLSGHVWQHILDYFFQTSLALYGEEPAANDWLNYAYELFLARAPVLGGLDGGWVEGASYFRMNMATLLNIPLYVKALTGFDFINAHPWYRENVKWMVYHLPPGSASDGFSDNSEEVRKPGPEYMAYAEEIAKLTGSNLAAWYARECRKYENPDMSKTESIRWIRLTKTRDLRMPDAQQQPDLPMGALFKDIGLAALHTSPENTATDLAIVFKSSPLGAYGHLLCDQNVFNILYGGQPVFFRTGYKVTMDDPHRTGWYQTTKSQNGILVNGEGQPYASESYGLITRFLQGNEIAYMKGDASNAYPLKKDNTEVRKFFRHIVLLKPDIIIIYDELEADQETGWSWLIHSLQDMKIDEANQTFSTSLPNAKGIAKLWGSQPVKWELADTADVRASNWRGAKHADGSLKSYEAPQFHLKITNREKCRNMRFMAVLQVSPDAGSLSKINASPDENGFLNFSIGTWNITAHLNPKLPPELFIRKTDEQSAFSLNSKNVILNGKTYTGKAENSSKLVETRNGKLTFSEATDDLPWNVQEAILNQNQQN